LYVEFMDDVEEEDLDNILSLMLEFGIESQLTIHRLLEYGKEIAIEDALGVIRKHFPLRK
ncbi:adaptor protein MecA, partial [Actinocorallia longicatena]